MTMRSAVTSARIATASSRSDVRRVVSAIPNWSGAAKENEGHHPAPGKRYRRQPCPRRCRVAPDRQKRVDERTIETAEIASVEDRDRARGDHDRLNRQRTVELEPVVGLAAAGVQQR